ncbi:MAG: SHOCT domain-containing protein [Fibromonadaceae bacterium]|jgi:hypothetical protein|nr:SHOCT domain-containing protein [Fibromonadaceae bacterium]
MNKEKFLDTFLGDTSNLPYIKKERHNYLTNYLYIVLFMNIFAIIRSVKSIIGFKSVADMDFYLNYLALSLTGIICKILLLNWQMSGFYIHCIVSIILGIIILPNGLFAICWGIFWALLDFAFLQLKKDNISAWTHLTGNYSNVSNMDFNEILKNNHSESDSNSNVPTTDPADEISKYFALKEKGIITEEEFEMKKRKLLGI